MVLSGFRVCCRGAHESAKRAGRSRPDRNLPTFSLAIRTKQAYDSVVGFAARERQCVNFNNSAHPIQREILVSRPLRPSDRQAQPSIGTQENHGSKSPLADAGMSRGVYGYLALALKGFVRCNSRPFRRGNGQVRPKFERTRRSEARGSVSVNSNRCHEIGKTGFVRLASDAHHLRWLTERKETIMIQGIIDELHKHGLSDLAQYLGIWQTYATEHQLKALYSVLESARFNKRYTLGEVISK